MTNKYTHRMGSFVFHLSYHNMGNHTNNWIYLSSVVFYFNVWYLTLTVFLMTKKNVLGEDCYHIYTIILKKCICYAYWFSLKRPRISLGNNLQHIWLSFFLRRLRTVFYDNKLFIMFVIVVFFILRQTAYLFRWRKETAATGVGSQICKDVVKWERVFFFSNI
jgi:hypothetical protein